MPARGTAIRREAGYPRLGGGISDFGFRISDLSARGEGHSLWSLLPALGRRKGIRKYRFSSQFLIQPLAKFLSSRAREFDERVEGSPEAGDNLIYRHSLSSGDPSTRFARSG